MSYRLWRRKVTLTLGNESGEGLEFGEEFRIGFDVEMSDSSEPNKAKIKLYNPSSGTVEKMQADDALVKLAVGYESVNGGIPLQIFQGNPITDGVKLEPSGVDRVLSIEAQDGGREYTTSHVSTSFHTATRSDQLFAALADSMGLPLGNIDAVVSDVEFSGGLALSGRASDIMERVAEMSGAKWGIRDGTIQVWVDGESTGETAVVFSSEAGNLIDRPTITDDGVEIKALLSATLRPGKAFRIESIDVTGDYTATAVRFTGDSGWSTEFYVEATGTPLATVGA